MGDAWGNIAKITQGTMQAVGAASQIAGDIGRIEAQSQLDSADRVLRKQISQFNSELLKNPNYNKYGELWEDKKKELYAYARENVTNTIAQKAVEEQIENLDIRQQQELTKIVTKRQKENIFHSEKNRLNDLLADASITEREKIQEVQKSYSRLTESNILGREEAKGEVEKTARAVIYNGYKNRALSDLREGKPLNKVMGELSSVTGRREGNALFAVNGEEIVLTGEEKNELVNDVRREWEYIEAQREEQRQKVNKKLFGRGLDRFRHKNLTFKDIDRLRKQGLDADNAIRLHDRLEGYYAAIRKERQASDEGKQVKNADNLESNIHAAVRSGQMNPKRGEELVISAEKAGVFERNTAESLLDNIEEQTREKPIVSSDLMDYIETFAAGEKPVVPRSQIGILKERFIDIVKNNKWKPDGSPNPNAWSTEEQKKQWESLVLPYREEFIKEAVKTNMKGVQPGQEGWRLGVGKAERVYKKDVETLDTFEELETHVLSLMKAGETFDKESLEKLYALGVDEHLKNEHTWWYEKYRTDDMGEIDKIDMYNGVWPVFTDKNGKRWTVDVDPTTKTEVWKEWPYLRRAQNPETGEERGYNVETGEWETIDWDEEKARHGLGYSY